MVGMISGIVKRANELRGRGCRAAFCLALLAPFAGTGAKAAPPPQQCSRVQMRGQVQAGHGWSQPFGQGWVFRLIPIKPGGQGYSGWDLAVDRVQGAGFPDALLLGTPPYESINQREVGTTFGLRAQDAIGWNPRSFRFLTIPADLRKAQRLYFIARGANNAKHIVRDREQPSNGRPSNPDEAAASNSLMELVERSSAGQFRIVNAALTPGTANALPYAQNWALQQRNTPHTITDTDEATPYGKLDSLEFEITLWLPASWKTPKSLEVSPAACR